MVRAASLAAFALLTLQVAPAAQDNGRDRASATTVSTREPDLSGVWMGVDASAADVFNVAELARLYTTEARRKMQQMTAQDDPALRCIPHAFPRALMVPKPFQIVQAPGMLAILIETMHAYRLIPTDGRRHPGEDLLYPTFQGDSVGHWEGDTLVVDVVAFNGQTWLADGRIKPAGASVGAWFTSDELHIVERWRRVDASRLEYQATVEDPQVLTRPWKTSKVVLKRQPITQINEVICNR
jgi:hypothetical protein